MGALAVAPVWEGEEVVRRVFRPVQRIVVDLGDDQVAGAEEAPLGFQVLREPEVGALPDEDNRGLLATIRDNDDRAEGVPAVDFERKRMQASPSAPP